MGGLGGDGRKCSWACGRGEQERLSTTGNGAETNELASPGAHKVRCDMTEGLRLLQHGIEGPLSSAKRRRLFVV